MRLGPGSAAVCSLAAVAATAAFVTMAQVPPPHRCIGSGGIGPDAQPAAVLVLVEDLENGDSNQLLLKATTQMAKQLSPDDLVGLTNGTDYAQLAVPLQPVGDGKHLAQVLSQVDSIGDPASYEPAFEAAAAALEGRGEIKQVIVLGDGDADPPDPATLERLVESGAEISAIGVDYDHNPAQMQAMKAIATHGQGTFQVVPDGNSASPALTRTLCWGGLRSR